MPRAYRPKTGVEGYGESAVPLNVHPDSALTEREVDRGRIWRSGLYRSQGGGLEPVLVPAVTEASPTARTHDMLVEPLGSTALAIPLPPGAALNPRFSQEGIHATQFLSHIELSLDPAHARDTSLVVHDLLIELGSSGGVRTEKFPAGDALSPNEVLGKIQDIADQLEEEKSSLLETPGARERLTAHKELMRELHEIWSGPGVPMEKRLAAAERVQSFISGKLFLYSKDVRQQELDDAVTEFLGTRFGAGDDALTHLLVGKFDCDGAAKLGVDIFNTSQSEAVAAQAVRPEDAEAALIMTGYTKDPARWALAPERTEGKRFGNIDGRNTGHGIMVLAGQGEKGNVSIREFDMTPRLLDPATREMLASESLGDVEARVIERLRKGLEPDVLLAPLSALEQKGASGIPEWENVTNLKRLLQENWAISGLNEKDKDRLLEIGIKSVENLRALRERLSDDSATPEDRAHALDLLLLVHEISVGSRNAAYEPFQETIADAIEDRHFLQPLIEAGLRSGRLPDDLHLLLVDELGSYRYPESARDGEYQRRDRLLTEVLERADRAAPDDIKKAEAFSLFTSYMRGSCNESETLNWLEDKSFELLSALEGTDPSIRGIKLNFLNRFYPSFFEMAKESIDGMLTPEQAQRLDKRAALRHIRYARETLKYFEPASLTNQEMQKRAGTEFSPSWLPGAYERPELVTLTRGHYPVTGWSIIRTNTEACGAGGILGRFFGSNGYESTEPARQFQKLDASHQDEAVGIAYATALRGTADDIDRAANIGKGNIEFYQFRPVDVEAKQRGVGYVGIDSAPAEALERLGSFFSSEEGMRYLEERYRDFEPVSQNLDVPELAARQTPKTQRKIGREFAEAVIRDAEKKFFEPGMQGKIDPLVRKNIISLIEGKAIHAQSELAHRGGSWTKPEKDW